jgi:hypothetical protein
VWQEPAPDILGVEHNAGQRARPPGHLERPQRLPKVAQQSDPTGIPRPGCKRSRPAGDIGQREHPGQIAQPNTAQRFRAQPATHPCWWNQAGDIATAQCLQQSAPKPHTRKRGARAQATQLIGAGREPGDRPADPAALVGQAMQGYLFEPGCDGARTAGRPGAAVPERNKRAGHLATNQRLELAQDRVNICHKWRGDVMDQHKEPSLAGDLSAYDHAILPS